MRYAAALLNEPTTAHAEEAVAVARQVIYESPAGRGVGEAREFASRLLSATPDDPWARVLAAEVAERSGDVPSANAHRVAAAQRWRDADSDLPLVARVRRELDAAPAGPRTAHTLE